MNSRDADMSIEVPKLQEMDNMRGELLRLSSAPIPPPFEENGWGHWLAERARMMQKLLMSPHEITP